MESVTFQVVGLTCSWEGFPTVGRTVPVLANVFVEKLKRSVIQISSKLVDLNLLKLFE